MLKRTDRIPSSMDILLKKVCIMQLQSFPLKAWELITLPCARFAVIKSIEKFLLVAAGRFLFTSMPVIRSGGRWQSLKYYDLYYYDATDFYLKLEFPTA